jgi:selenide, water dikinase
LAQVLRRLTPSAHPDVIVATGTGDDAGVWRIDAARALVATVDYLTPVVDDARTWGRIAAVNAASDVYAMGGRPLFALNLVGWPADELPTALLSEVLEGAAEAAAEGGWVTIGGHSVDDPEPKMGLAVVGEAHPERLLRNDRLRDGDVLVLTKPLGTGILATAVKRGDAPAETFAAGVAQMTRLNDDAAAVALRAGATGATDVTGFGLLGHLGGMVEASALDAVIEVAAVPLLPRIAEVAATGAVPGGTRRNLAYVRPRLEGAVDEATAVLLADAQTSGGMLFGVTRDQVAGVLEELAGTGHTAAAVGAVRAGTGRIALR